MTAFKTLAEHSLSALAITDKHQDGKLVGTLSVSDLRSISGRAEIEKLIEEMRNMNVSDFLSRVKESSLNRVTDLVTCQEGKTLEAVMQRALESKVHRVWIVDGDQRPVGVMSYTDMISLFLSGV